MVGVDGGERGPGGLDARISQHRIQQNSLSHLRPCIPVHILTVCIYSTFSILSHTGVGQLPRVLFLSDDAKLVLVSIYTLTAKKKKYQEGKKKYRTFLLHFCKIFSLQARVH